MTEIAFYHLQRQSLEEALPLLLEKAYANGGRSLVLTHSVAQMQALDGHLWTYRRDGFLPHGTREGKFKDEQPILLTDRAENLNQASFLFLAAGGDLDFIAGFARCFDLFDGNDEAAMAAARQRWSMAKAASIHTLTYWRQDEGRWRKVDL